jgi:Fe-S-cluster containining protein
MLPEPKSRLPKRDQELVQILDSAFADAARRSGEWLACRPGCMQCCIGVFAINRLDALRLREGLDRLSRSDPNRAEAVRGRARASVERLSQDFPGDPSSGLLGTSREEQERFEEFANDEPCPALDPERGLCDLYEHRPVGCRIFGPPVRSRSGADEGLGVCELCYRGATAEEIARCEMTVDPDGLEAQALDEVSAQSASSGSDVDKRELTLVAFALVGRDS